MGRLQDDDDIDALLGEVAVLYRPSSVQSSNHAVLASGSLLRHCSLLHPLMQFLALGVEEEVCRVVVREAGRMDLLCRLGCSREAIVVEKYGSLLCSHSKSRVGAIRVVLLSSTCTLFHHLPGQILLISKA